MPSRSQGGRRRNRTEQGYCAASLPRTRANCGTRGTGIDLTEQILTIWVIKVAWETAATPVTYAVVGYLKRTEGVDVYDADARLNPLAFLRSR